MADIIQNKMNQILGDLARPTKFKCQIYPPDNISFKHSLYGTGNDERMFSSSETAQYLDYFCYAASFPGLTVNSLDFKYRGRNIPVKSIQEYSQKWTATFYNDERHAVRQLFFDWMLFDQKYRYDTSIESNNKIANTSISIFQLDFELAKDCVVYTLMNAYPSNVSDIEVMYDGLNQIETFTVEFAYTHFEINKVSGVGLTSSEVNALIQNTIQNTLNGIKELTFNKLNDVTNSITDSISNPFDSFLG